MSVVVAKIVNNQSGKWIQFAADSFCTLSGNHNLMRNDSEKIFKLGHKINTSNGKGEFLLGSIGDFRDKHEFAEFLNHTSFDQLENRTAVFNMFSLWRRWKQEHLLNDKDKSVFLLGCNAGLFLYRPDGELLFVPDYYAIGAGGEVATVLLSEGYDPPKVVEVCCRELTYCGGKVQTKALKIR